MKKLHLIYKNLMPAVLLPLALAGASSSLAAYTPVPITATSYNQNAIVESNACMSGDCPENLRERAFRFTLQILRC